MRVKREFFAITDRLLGLDDSAPGVGDTYFGREDVEIGGDARRFADFVFLKELRGEFEAALFDDQILPGISADCSRRFRCRG